MHILLTHLYTNARLPCLFFFHIPLKTKRSSILHSMHLLFTRFPLESALGGAEIQTLSLMEGLRARGHTVRFAGSCPILLQECAQRGFPVHRCDIGAPPVTKGGAISFLWRKKKMQKQLEAMMKEIGTPDAVCMLSLSEKLLLTDILTSNQNSKFNIQNSIYWIEHDPIGRWLTMNPWLPRLRRLSRMVTTIVVSDLSRNMYLHLGWDHDRTIAIPNGIDSTRLGTPFTRERHKKNEPLRLGCIARLAPEKGIDLLLQALHALPPFVTLAIVGTGKEEHTLHQLTKTLELQDRVTFLLPTTNIHALYEQFDALVLPSRTHDPFGLTTAEAMALGLPVIVTDACGIAKLLNGTDALIVPANSSEGLQESILHLLEPATFNRLAKNGPNVAREKCSMERMVQSYENVFTTVASLSHPS